MEIRPWCEAVLRGGRRRQSKQRSPVPGDLPLMVTAKLGDRGAKLELRTSRLRNGLCVAFGVRIRYQDPNTSIVVFDA